MVYQEDVIKIALHFAGVPASDGDVLRRASGKGRSVAALQK
jgi:DNA polymerase-3 subunit alpha/error-prone DNA polymerase